MSCKAQWSQCVPGTADDSPCLTGGFFIRLCTCHNITWLLPALFACHFLCACVGLSNTETSGKFVLLTGNCKIERMPKFWNDKVHIFSHSCSFLNYLCSVQASITDVFFFSPFSMLVVLVMVFAICWAPFHIDRLFFSFVVEWTEPLANIFNLIHVVSGKVFFFHLHRGWQKKHLWVVYLKYVVIYFVGDVRHAWKSFLVFGGQWWELCLK